MQVIAVFDGAMIDMDLLSRWEAGRPGSWKA
jgi:hypothetical protein